MGCLSSKQRAAEAAAELEGARPAFGAKPQLGGVDLKRHSASIRAARPLSAIPLTCEAWVKVERGMSGRIGCVVGTYPKKDCICWDIHAQGEPRLFWGHHVIDWKCAAADLRTGEWTHLAFVVNEERTEATIYVDGRSVGQHRASFGALIPKRPPRVGGDERSGDGVGLAPQFAVGMVRLWSSARTQAELCEFAKASPTELPSAGLLLHYAFDPRTDSDGRIVDHSPNANHGAIVGGRPLGWLSSSSPLVVVG